jgi:MoaA/NifB/PqqE/SkfB family radical SAM enzyme
MRYKKVFGIGMGRTGTKSLNSALNILGIKSLHDPNKVPELLNYEKKNNLKILSTLKEFQGFTDHPFNKIYKEVDKVYPNSKFILTVRNLESWLISKKNHIIMHKHDPRHGRNLRKIKIDSWTERMKKHITEVKEYFKNRPDDLLIIDVCKGQGWEKLCPFLDLPIPNQPFPHENPSYKDYDLKVGWEINKACNFSCPYCYNPEEKRKDFSVKNNPDININDIGKFFNNLEKTCLITLTGGEPFLLPNFIKLCEKLTKKHFISVITNLSSPLVYEFAEKIKPGRVKSIICSLHFPEIKRLNLKKDIIEKFNFLKNKGFSIDVGMVMWPPVLKKFPEIHEEFKKHGVLINPKGFKGLYNGKDYPDAYTKKQTEIMRYYQELNKKLNSEGKNLGDFIQPKLNLQKLKKKKVSDIFSGHLSFKGLPCLAGKSHIRILSNGNVKRCVSEKMILGNVFKGNLKLLEKPLRCNSEICRCHYEGVGYALGNPKVIKNSFFKNIQLKLSRVLGT